MAARCFARTIPALGLCLTFGISSVLWAQATEQQRPTRTGQQQAGQQQLQQRTTHPIQALRSEAMDSLFASWLIGDNQVEVQLSRLAIDRSQNEQVRQFAQRMVQEHQQLIDQLHRTGMGIEGQAAGQQSQQQRQPGQQATQIRQRLQQQTQQRQDQPRQQAQQQPSQSRQQAQQQPGQQRPRVAQQRLQPQGERQAGYRPQADQQQQARSMPAMQLIEVHKKAGDQFVTHMRQELQNKQGAEFDRAFMGGQIFAHNKMLSTLEAMQDKASPELKKTLDQAITSTQQHLQEARNIARALEPAAAATAAQPESRETQRE